MSASRDFAPILRVSDVPGQMTYRRSANAHNSTHIGQIKLFLGAVEFLALPITEKCDIVVYAGSAPGHTHQVLADLFPRIRAFILVDPHERYIMGPRGANCVYLRSSSMHDDVSGARPNPHRDICFLSRDHIEVRIAKDDLRINSATPGSIAIDGAEGIARAIAQHMDTTIGRGATTFYIIEDLFTDDLAHAIAHAFDTSRIAFISDIRTRASDDDDHPGDWDVVTNNMMQQTWAHIMLPRAIMFKFRTPFFNRSDARTLAKLIDSPICAQYCATFGFTPEEIYDPTHRAYRYLGHQSGPHEGLYLQAFAGSSSSETRLIATREGTNNYEHIIWYDVRTFEDTMFYYNHMRDFSTTQRHAALWRTVPGFDGCPDCDLAIRILQMIPPRSTDRDALSPMDILARVLRVSGRTLAQGRHGMRL
jgi:hypothetical protein